jgi:uncharacterized DUF497 family protein
MESQPYVTFEWDLGNCTKNFIKHKITIEEAESVFNQPGAIRELGEQISPKVWNTWSYLQSTACIRVFYDTWL